MYMTTSSASKEVLIEYAVCELGLDVWHNTIVKEVTERKPLRRAKSILQLAMQ